MGTSGAEKIPINFASKKVHDGYSARKAKHYKLLIQMDIWVLVSQKHDVSLEPRQILISQYICMYKHNPNNKVIFTGILNMYSTW